MVASYVPTPAQPPVSEEYIAGLLESGLKVDIFESAIRVSIASTELKTIDLVRSFFKTTRETATFIPNKPAKITINLDTDQQRLALQVASTRCVLQKKVALVALQALDAKEAGALTDDITAQLKLAISESKKLVPSEEELANAPVVSPEYAAAIIDQRAASIPAKPLKPPTVEAAVEGETAPKKTKKAKKAPKARFGKVQINLTKPQAVIIQSIKTAFGGVSKKNAPHRLTITRETGESWLSTILPETHIRTDAFNVISVPA